MNTEFILESISYKLSKLLICEVSVVCDDIRTLNFITNSLYKKNTDAVLTFRKRSDLVYAIDISGGIRGETDLTMTYNHDELMEYFIIKRLDKFKKISD